MAIARTEYHFNYKPHPGQIELHRSAARFRVCATGRRWGKTLAGDMEIFKYAVDHPRSFCLWVAPIYDQARIAWRMLDRVPDDLVRRQETLLEMELWNGSRIKFGSGEKPRHLEGHAINRLICDETSFLKRELWENSLSPALADTGGDAIFFGKPFGKNWFYELWMRGQRNAQGEPINPQFPDWQSFHFPTENNPYVPNVSIEAAKLALPCAVFEQEFLAKFLDDGAGVFRGVREALRGYIQKDPVPGRSYGMGVDIARKEDWTVLTVIDLTTRQIVWVDRFNKIDWPFIEARIVATAIKYNNAIVGIDSTGVGDPVYQNLKRKGLSIRPYQFTNESKKDLIENAVIEIEFERIHLPVDIPEVFLHELDIFQSEYTKAGNVRYSAPEGYHDDCVISVCLAIWIAGSRQGVNIAWV
jgi:hypothetical protein